MQKNRPPNPLTTEQPFLVMKHPFSLRLTALPVHPSSNPHIYAKRRIKAQIKKAMRFPVTTQFTTLAPASVVN